MSDFVIDKADQWRYAAWKVIANTPQYQWQILTKRPERIKDHLPIDWGATGYRQVWFGVSIGDQDYVERMKILTDLKTDGSEFLCFLSLEPLLGPLDFVSDPVLRESFEKVDWVILGGESGNETGKYRYRPSEIAWYEHIIDQCDQCDQFGIPVFVKQLGTALYRQFGMRDWKGGDFDKFPPKLQRREYPR